MGILCYHPHLLPYLPLQLPSQHLLCFIFEALSTTGLRSTIADCLAGAKSDSEHLQLKALQTLSTITNLSPHNRTSVAQTPTCVPTILTLTTSPNPTIQSLSLSVLFNLSLNPDLKHSLADTQTIRRLTSTISSATAPDSLRIASSLICSLAMLDKNKARFGVAGTVQALVEAVSISSALPNPASHHLLTTLSELVQFHGNCTLAVRAGAVRILIQLVNKRDAEDDLAGTALAILALLARFHEGLSELKKTDGVVVTMVDVLRGRCMLSKEGAADILLRLFDESEDCLREAAMRVPDLLQVVADVSVRASFRAREKAGLLMTKMMDLELPTQLK